MNNKIKTILPLTILTFFILQIRETMANPSDNLIIKGLVSNPLNITYNEVQSLPMITENVSLQCVYAPYGRIYTWTGVPLFYLLNLAGIQPNAKEVVFYAEDGFSSSLTIEKAMHPTTILALKVNGTALPYQDNYFEGGLPGGYPYKVVVPCKYGYKWVGWIDAIEVVDYDYKGFYESRGFSDEADIPNCATLPTTTPPYIEVIATWRDTYTLTVFTNASILNAGFNETTKRLYFAISNNASKSFMYIVIPKRLLTKSFTVLQNNMTMPHYVIQSETNSFLYFTVNQSACYIEIKGTLLADVTGPMGVSDGKVDMRDISTIARCFETHVGDPNYIAKYDIIEDGAINMNDIGVAARDFGKAIP